MKKILWYFRKPTGNVEEGNPPVIQPLFKNRTWFSFWSRDVLRRTNGNTSRLRILNMSSQKLKTSEIVPTGLSVEAAIIMPQSHLHPHCWLTTCLQRPPKEDIHILLFIVLEYIWLDYRKKAALFISASVVVVNHRFFVEEIHIFLWSSSEWTPTTFCCWRGLRFSGK